MGPRWIGAAAGLVPAAAVLVLFGALGGYPNRDDVPWLAGIAILAVAAGSLVGPVALGSFQSDLRALVAYALVGAFGFLLLGTLASVWTDLGASASALGALGARIAGQILYGLLYLPFWAGAVAPFSLVWVLAVRVLRRRAGLAPAGATSVASTVAAANARGISPRRMGMFAAALIAAYGLFVAVLPLVIYHDPRPPWAIYRPIALFVLFLVPAVIAAIGVIWDDRSLLVAAGVICLLQAYVAFSGVTIGFLVPGILLMVLGSGNRWPTKTRVTRTGLVAGIAVVVLTVGAWVATLGLTEEICWTALPNPDGSLTFERVPASNTMTLIPAHAASGCDGGTLTVEGIGLGSVMAIGAVAVAAASVWTRRGSVARD